MNKAIILFGALFVIIVVVLLAKKNKQDPSWTQQQKIAVSDKLQRILLCPDVAKDQKIANCALKKLMMYNSNEVMTELGKGEGSPKIQEVLAGCYKQANCQLPDWSEANKKQAFDLILQRNSSDNSCGKPEIVSNRSMCELEGTHKILSYQDMILYHTDGITPSPKISMMLEGIRSDCIIRYPCTDGAPQK